MFIVNKMNNGLADISKSKTEKSNHLCRVCLTENINQLKSLYEVDGSMSAAEKVMLCTGVRMRHADGLPGAICRHCSGELEAANSFRVKCEYSDSLLKKFYINGVLVKSLDEDVELAVDASIVKQEEELCEPWIKLEDEANDKDEQFSSDDYSPEIASETGEKNLKRIPKKHKKSKDPSDTVITNNCIKEGEEAEKHVNISCQLCNKPLANKHSLENHMRSMHSEERKRRVGDVTGYGPTKRYHCPECEYSTPRRHNLLYHARTHTGERPYRCEVCESNFTQPGSLIAHHRNRHSDKMYFTCPECGKQFKIKQKYERHKLVHSDVRKYVCTICNKGYKTSYTLKQHTERHLNLRNYSCEICGSRFVTVNDLSNHAKQHSDVKNFECNICGFRTKLKQVLLKHVKRHSGERPFKCELCEFSAYDRGGLKRHMRKHTREKNYACPVCSVKFTASSSVNKHMLRLHGIKYKMSDHTDRRFIK